MPFTLTDLRAEIERRLAADVDPATWSDAIKDEGVRHALDLYSRRGPVYEEDLIVISGGHEQPLDALPGLLAVEAIAWPWEDGATLEARAVRWRLVHPPARVRFDRAAPAAGDRLRLRYRRSHAVSGLDGASATTVPDAHRPVLALGAALFTALLRTRQLSENPALPRDAAAELRAWCAHTEIEFTEQLALLAAAPRTPAWPEVGL